MAGVVVTRGDPRNPRVVTKFGLAAGKVASSFQAEMVAVGGALKWLEECSEEWGRATVASDSQASLRALKELGAGRAESVLVAANECVTRLREGGKRVRFVWIPGHSDVTGNEWADEEANKARGLEQSGVECCWKSVRARWKRREREQQFTHERCRKIYGGGLKRETDDWCRRDAVRMVRLRTGHSLELGAYRVRIGLEEEGSCRRCGAEPETIEHVWDCPAGLLKRRWLGAEGVGVLAGDPTTAWEYWRWWDGGRPPEVSQQQQQQPQQQQQQLQQQQQQQQQGQ